MAADCPADDCWMRASSLSDGVDPERRRDRVQYAVRPAIHRTADAPRGSHRSWWVAPHGSRRAVERRPDHRVPILSAVGSHVYYEVANKSYDAISFYRARLDGTSPPEKVIDVSAYNVSVSPDERTVAWVGFDQAVRRYLLVTTDIASGARRTYALDYTADRITWSPTGRTIVIEPNGGSTPGAPLQWVDLASGAVRVWSEPSPAGTDILPSRHIGLDGESPTVYVAGVDVARYSMATGSRELLSTLTAPGRAIGWSPDFETVTIETTTCRAWAGGNGSRWTNSVDRVAWRSTVEPASSDSMGRRRCSDARRRRARGSVMNTTVAGVLRRR